MSIKVGILGHGNLGKGVELAVMQNSDMELAAILTRRDPASIEPLTPGVRVFNASEADCLRDRIDVLILCGGSATDLPEQTPVMAELFTVVDSFDTHARIPEHFANVDAAAKKGGNVAVISAGWDPGMFSINRVYDNAILLNGRDYTFWGKGVSQGHSDAVRRIDGVIDARQYTVPIAEALDTVRSGETPLLTTREKHLRECYVVAEEDADRQRIEFEIKNMPNYFSDYNTTVHFISREEMARDHSGLPHGGFVIRSGRTGVGMEHNHVIEYRLSLDSNPEFTSCVLVACARAAHRMSLDGQSGCRTLLDIPPAYLSPLSGGELRATML